MLTTTSEALRQIKDRLGLDITLPTLIAWMEKYGFGKKIGGRWYCDQELLNKFIAEGKIKKDGKTPQSI